jgi:lysozyme family protein
MTTPDYKPFVDRLIQRYEGGYGWNPRDPGGPTKYGITCYDLAEHRGKQMISMETWAPLVEAMPLFEAEDIYAAKYATACEFDELNAGPDCVVFDFAVNSGPSRAIKYAQAVVGVPEDGVMGPVTLAAINAMDPNKFIDSLCDHRLGFLRALETWPTFGAGWAARVADLRTYSHNLANSAAPSAPVASVAAPTPGKAFHLADLPIAA